MRTTITGLVTGLALMALGGCSREPTVEEVRTEAGQLAKLVPGNYETRVRVTRFKAPGIPSAQREALERKLGGSAQVVERCVTPEEADKGIQPMLDSILGQRECKFEQFDVAGNRIRGELACQTGLGPAARMKLDGTVEPEQISAATNMSIKLPFPPIGVDVDMQIDMKRTGACKPAQPAAPDAGAPADTKAQQQQP